MDTDIDKLFVNGYASFISLTIFTLAIGLIVWFSIKLKIKKYNETHPEHEVSGRFVSSAVRFADLTIVTLTIAGQVIPLRPAVEMMCSASSVLAICSTFAAKESLSNYIAGFLLSIHRPFKVGDIVVLNMDYMQIKGIIEDITLRHTVVKEENGSTVTIPNSRMNNVAVEVLVPRD